MRLFILRAVQLVTVSGLFTASGLLFPWTDYRHASEFDKTVPLWSSDYRPTTVWGSPLPYAIDSPKQSTLNAVSNDDLFLREGFIFDWIVWLIVVTTAYLFWEAISLLLARRSAWDLQPHPIANTHEP